MAVEWQNSGSWSNFPRKSHFLDSAHAAKEDTHYRLLIHRLTCDFGLNCATTKHNIALR